MLQMHRYLCSYYGRETVHDEFKVFCINTNTWQQHFENEEVYAIFHDSAYFIDRQRFDQMIKVEIGNYFNRYFAKYVASFISSGIQGKIHIGLSDSGIIEGIPFFGNINNVELQSHVKNCFASNIRIKNSSKNITIDNIMENVTLIFNELEQNELSHDSDNSAYIRLYSRLDEKEKCKQKWRDYQHRYKKWHDELSIHNVKLRELINMKDVQQCMINYIRDNQSKYECDLTDVIAYYESQPVIDFDITMQMIVDIEKNHQSPFYWLINYKDYKMEEIQRRKPMAPTQQPSDFNYVNFAQHMMNIRPYLLTQRCKFYTLTIAINQINECKLEYLDVKGEWQMKKRVMHNESIGPITTNYE